MRSSRPRIVSSLELIVCCYDSGHQPSLLRGGLTQVLALMSTFTASSTIEFLSLIEDYGREAMFRGQADSSWPLVPSIARYSAALEPGGYDCISDLEDHLLDRFRILGVPFRDFRGMPRFEQLIHAQHYGLPTRLLDWSTNPLKALFFAVENPQLDDTDAAVYMTRPYFWSEGTTSLKDDGEHAACFPELLHERISAQDACVLSFPLPKNSMNVPELTADDLPRSLEFLHKFAVPSSCKQELRKQLAVLGVTHRTVYPGLEGTTRWIKSELSEFKV